MKTFVFLPECLLDALLSLVKTEGLADCGLKNTAAALMFSRRLLPKTQGNRMKKSSLAVLAFIFFEETSKSSGNKSLFLFTRIHPLVSLLNIPPLGEKNHPLQFFVLDFWLAVSAVCW